MNEDDGEAVSEANLAFYRAFESLDLGRMEEAWHRFPTVQCTHPGWARLKGFAEVMASWARIFENTLEVRIEIEEESVFVAGDVAWLVCTEVLTTSTLDGPTKARVEATNVFERRDGIWRLVHHHGSPVIGPVEPDDPASSLH